LLDQRVNLIALDRDEQGLTSAFGGPGSATVTADMGAEDTWAVADRLIHDHGPIELVVNNVGIETDHDFLSLSEADFDRVFQTNLRGPWFFTKRLIADLVERERHGSILFISSLHDRRVYGKPHYSASKAAVSMLVRELAWKFGPLGIRVNAISPGGIDSGYQLEDPAREEIPLGRVGYPGDIAPMAVALLSDEYARYVSGTNVRVDGGAALKHIWT
jgi:NAD(P)-dependent dehydrogenase (short-subunit alcohol dehydrogenase family)